METGEFWTRQGHRVDRKTGVDTQLLGDLSRLERDLVKGGLDHDEAQGLIGRTVFAQYLIDREIVTSERLRELCGSVQLADILVDREAAGRLFGWLRDTFNGDMFSPLRGIPPGNGALEQGSRASCVQWIRIPVSCPFFRTGSTLSLWS